MSTLSVSCLAAVALCICVPQLQAKPMDGYIVTAQWDGGTVPAVRWGLDVTRQDVDWRFKQKLKLSQLIPPTPGPALSPTFTAYDASSRAYFTTTRRDLITASLWGVTIADDVENATVLTAEVKYKFPEADSVLVGLVVAAANSAAVPDVFAVFKSGAVVSVDPHTGATQPFANLTNASFTTTTALALDPVAGQLHAVVQAYEGKPAQSIATLSLATRKSTLTKIQKLPAHNEADALPFEMLWLPTLKQCLVFFTGGYDQIVYVDPTTGSAEFAISDLSQYSDGNGWFEFYADDDLEDDDKWTAAAIDPATGKLYFQCTVDTDDDDTTTSLCVSEIPTAVKKFSYVDTAMSPLTYGYAGYQWVSVIN